MIHPGCFLAGTLVASASGMVPIEKFEAGDEICSYDHETQKWQLREVERVFKYEYFGDIVTLTIQYEDDESDMEIGTAPIDRFNKATGLEYPIPHVHAPSVPGGVPPALPGEIPK